MGRLIQGIVVAGFQIKSGMTSKGMIMNQKKMIMVTGGAGYIGSFTVKQLLTAGYEVLVVDSMETGHEAALHAATDSLQLTTHNNLILEIADIGDQSRMREIFDKYPIEAVIDFAAYLAVGESMENPKKYLENNVVNFVKLLDVMKEKGCRFIIKSSTAATYGNPDDKYFPLREDYQELVKPKESDLLPGKWDGKEVEKEAFFLAFMDEYREIFKNRPDLWLSEEELAKLRITTSIYGLTKLLDEIVLRKYEGAAGSRDQVTTSRHSGRDGIPDLVDAPKGAESNSIIGSRVKPGMTAINTGIKSIALRYFNVCGASEDGQMGDDKPNPSNLMTLVIYNALGKIDKLKVFGDDYPTKDGTGLRDYIHPIDLAKGHVKALKYLLDKQESNVFNLGTGDAYTVFELIKEVEKASGKKVKYEIMSRRSGDPALSYANPSKANDILGWQAEYTLERMATTAWKWHSTHPEGYRGGSW